MVVALSTTTAFSQAGSFAVGVGSNMAEESWQDYSLTPSLGYFIADNMLVGMHFSLQNGKDAAETKTSSMTLAPYFRYYLNEYLYGMAGIGITSGSTTPDGGDKAKNSGMDINAGVGLSLMWNERVAIEPSFGLAIGSTTANDGSGGDDVKTSSFGLVMGLGISLRLGGE